MNIRNTITRLLPVAVIVAAIAAVGAHRAAGQGDTLYTHEVGHLLGLVPGQTLRFSVSNPNAPGQGSEPVRAHTWLYDSTGRLIAQSEETAIAPGQFHSFDFNRDDLPVSGEPGTGRLQVRSVVQVLFSDGSVKPIRPSFPISIEVIENTKGKTIVGDYYTGTVTVSGDG